MNITLKLDKKPKSPTIIEGFPGFGLVGTIAVEFLLDHLKTEKIGRIDFNDGQPMVAIHAGKVVEPLGIFYNKEHNLLLVHAISSVHNGEWDMAAIINALAKQLSAKEVICLEGVGSGSKEETVQEPEVFFYTTDSKQKKAFEKIKVKPLAEGIIIGVTGAVLLRVDAAPVTCVFAETKMNLPDSKAAAKVIEVLDNYLGLDVDYKPLLEQAQKFEEKLQNILKKSAETKEQVDKKKLSYIS